MSAECGPCCKCGAPPLGRGDWRTIHGDAGQVPGMGDYSVCLSCSTILRVAEVREGVPIRFEEAQLSDVERDVGKEAAEKLEEVVSATYYRKTVRAVGEVLREFIHAEALSRKAAGKPPLPVRLKLKKMDPKVCFIGYLGSFREGYADCELSQRLLDTVIDKVPDATIAIFQASLLAAPEDIMAIEYTGPWTLPEGVRVAPLSKNAGQA